MKISVSNFGVIAPKILEQ